MAAFMSAQLDFIYFFHGLAFLLLGAVALTIARARRGGPWLFLAGFAFVHGAVEWCDLIAFTIVDQEVFAALRTALMALSYVLLLEFTRQEGLRLGLKLPGRWVHSLLAALVIAGWLGDGLSTANALARYLLGFTSAAATSAIFFYRATKVAEAQRSFEVAAAAGFGLYAIAAGLIVPSAPFWPASVLNQEWFGEVSGVPIQLVRGALAGLITFSVWAIWGQKLIAGISSSHYTAHFQRQIVGTLSALAIVLLSGWALTEYLGSVYKESTEAETRGELDLIASRLNGEVTSIVGMVHVVAGTPAAQQLTPGVAGRDGVLALELAVEATGAKLGYIINPTGQILAASGSRQAAVAGARNFLSSHCYHAAIKGRVAGGLFFNAESGSTDYYASSPIYGSSGQVISVAVLNKSLADFSADLRRYERPYFLVDPDGIVILTNRPEMRYRTMWPVSSEARARLTEKFSPLRDQPMLNREISNGAWETIDGERSYVERRFINESQWSLVVVKPVQEIFASRMLGIAITLLMLIGTLIYALGRGWSIQDSIQMMKRLELQKLASELKLSAITDPLTGLNNRRRFNEVLLLEIMRAKRYATPLSLVLYDIDHFKSINDAHGHLVGDKVLTQLSDLIASRIRGTDVLARWGGEEFAILLPGSDEKMALNLAENLRDLISDVTFEEVGTLTCSFGIAQYGGEATMEDLMRRADAALYRAKFNGRNRIETSVRPPERRIKTDTAA